MNKNIDFQLGLLNFAHLLMHADGVIDERERVAITSIKNEEGISNDVIDQFEKSIVGLKEKEIYDTGIKLLNQCSEEDKLCALVHLYRLAQADDSIHIKEVRFLFYALKMAKIEFEDVVLTANLARNNPIK